MMRKQMLRDLEAMLRGHRVLNRFQLGRKELDDLATLGTDHVIVMLMFVVVFVVGDAVAKANFARESCFGEQLERAIDSRLADAGIFLLDQPVEIFAGKMSFGAQKNVENQVALSGALESLLLNVFEENFLLFSH